MLKREKYYVRLYLRIKKDNRQRPMDAYSLGAFIPSMKVYKISIE